MTTSKAYEYIKGFLMQLLSSLGEQQWQNAKLLLEVQLNMMSFHGSCCVRGHQIPLDFRRSGKQKNRALAEILRLLHVQTTQQGSTKWNRAMFILSSAEAMLEAAFEWDQDWQDELDAADRKAYLEDPSYALPRWHWEQ